MVPVVFLMGVGPVAKWKQAVLPDITVRLRWAALAAVLAAVLHRSLPLANSIWAPPAAW